MTATSRGHGHAAAPREHISTNEKFLRDTAKTLEKLHAALASVSQRRQALASQVKTLADSYNRAIKSALSKALPDLSARTLADLDIAVPGFVTPKLKADIQAVLYPKVPFFTRLIGGTQEYLDKKASDALMWLQIRLRDCINGRNELPSGFEEAGAIKKTYAKAKNDYEVASAREKSLTDQIAGLERVQTAFADGTRPIPPKLAEAVANSAAQSTTSSGSSGSVHEFDYVNDILIPQVVWNSVFDRHSDHYYDRTYSGNGHWGGGDMPATQRRETTVEEGNASTRMGDAAEESEGNASLRMSDAAPAEDGNASVRMGEAATEETTAAAEPEAPESEPETSGPAEADTSSNNSEET